MNTETQAKTAVCGTCRFWSSSKDAQEGQCRRHAPQMLVFKIDEDMSYKSHFPATAKTDWCGDYQPE